MLKKLCLAAALLAAPAVSMADGLSYKFIEADYLNFDYEGSGSANGFGLGANFLIAPQWFLKGSYARFEESGVEFSTASGGVGWRHPLSTTVDFNAGASIVYAEVDVDGGGSADDTGYGLDAGLRALLAPKFELNGGVSYTDVGSGDGDFGFNAGGVFSFTPQLAIVGGVGVGDDFGDDGAIYNIGGRFMF